MEFTAFFDRIWEYQTNSNGNCRFKISHDNPRLDLDVVGLDASEYADVQIRIFGSHQDRKRDQNGAAVTHSYV